MKTFDLVAIGLLIAFVPMLWAGLTLWTDRNLDYWVSYFRGEEVDCSKWLAFGCVILGPVNVGINLIGEIARLCIPMEASNA